MQTTIPTLGTISWGRRLMPAAAALGLLLVFGFAQIGSAQIAPGLTLSDNYFVTGDYVVGGVGLRGLGVNGFATGTINIPDQNSVPATGVRPGADIVAAFLYWETVESNLMGAVTGQQGSFNGYAITGTPLGDPHAPTSWSSGGCSGSPGGSKTIRVYRADVRPFLPLDSNGKIQTPNAVTPGSYQVRLADSGTNGSGVPFTLGASLVIIYRVLSPIMPLNSIVIYDGVYAPSNSSPNMIQPIQGFYQAAASPVAKITHIVGNGQPKKSETVLLNTVNLPSLYPGVAPFPGVYNQNTISLSGGGSWDNPTWFPNAYGPAVRANDSSETTSVIPFDTSTGCVNWGAVIFSTTVQDTDGDGLLDVWEDNQGYIDAKSGQWVALPGAYKFVKDIFVEVDYLRNLSNDFGSAGTFLHSHLPKQAALDMVGNAFKNAPVSAAAGCDSTTHVCHGVNVHFDLGPGIYQGDPYVISYPVPPPPPGVPTFPGAGGNPISEGLFVCTDGATLCAFPGPAPGQPGPATVGWKGGYLFVKNNPTAPTPNSNLSLGNFQHGRKDSYHYVLFGHSLGEPRSSWSTAGNALSNPNISRLVSIMNSGTSATVTIQSPPGVLKPGDPVNPGDPAFGDGNLNRVTVSGAIGQPALNGTYLFSPVNSSPGPNGSTITTFNITTTVPCASPPCTYNFGNEPQLGVAYAGPKSSSGRSDFGGGADSAETFGSWGADDPFGCQPDPSVTLSAGQDYCNNEVGTVLEQAGTLMHEVGHTLTLTHGGTYYKDLNNPSVPTYGLNCKSNVLSVMSYLFQIRGFPDNHGIGYSSQIFPLLDETKLNESTGIDLDSLGHPAIHLSRWYGPPNALDNQLNTVGGRFAKTHCDGTPIGPNELPAVRVDGTLSSLPGSTFSGPLDWNNDLIVPDAVSPQQDVNFNGSTDAPFEGFNDWQAVDLRQIGARASAFGFSGGGGQGFDGGGQGFDGGGQGFDGGGQGFDGGGQGFDGGGQGFDGGGTEQDANTVNSTVDHPTLQTAVEPPGAHFVNLNWSAPGSRQQIRTYYIWRAVTTNAPISATNLPTNIGKATGTPLPTTFTDPNVKNGVTYTYFVTAALGADSGPNNGNQSGPSNMKTITINFSKGATGQ